MKNTVSLAVTGKSQAWVEISSGSSDSTHRVEGPSPSEGRLAELFFTTRLADGAEDPRARTCAALHLASLIALCLALCFSMVGCGGGYPGFSFTGLKTSAPAIDAGQKVMVTAVGDTMPLNWSDSGANCGGSACGTIVPGSGGTAMYIAPGSVAVPIQVTLTAALPGTSDTQSAALTVNPIPTLSGALPAGVVSAPYVASLHGSWGTGGLQYSISANALPAGLTLNATNGVISGTPTTAGVFSFTAQVTDSAPTPVSASIAETITVTTTGSGLQLFAGNPPIGVVGVPYSTQVTASGGSGGYVYGIANGPLPEGLSISPSTGIISGTPAVAGTSIVSAKVTDSSNATAMVALRITIADPLSIGTLPNATAGTPYNATIGVTGGTAPYVCSLSAGSLPAGMSMGSGCQVSGTPTTVGTYSLSVKAADSSNPVLTTTGPVSLTISPAGLSLSTGTLPAGTVGTPYSSSIGVTGGTSPYSCSITSGILPTGLSLGANCLVSGTPTAAGAANLTVKAIDSGNPAQTATGPVSITIYPAALSVTVGPLPNGTVGTLYSQTIPVTGGTSPYSCAITSGILPAGLSLGAGCVVSGTPTTAGTVSLIITAIDSSSPTKTASGVVTLTIDPAALAVTVGPLPNGTVGIAYSQVIPVTGGTSPYSCTIASGTLPAGLSLGAKCLVSGNPTTAGTSNLIVTATDSSNPAKTASGAVSITIDPAALTVTVGSLASGTVGVAYNQTIPVSGGASPYTCAITSGTLPAGLSLGAGCVVSGTPATAGTANLIVTATDSSSPAKTASGAVSITINPAALLVTVGPLPNGTVGLAYNQTIPVTGGISPYSCTITSGTLPAGLSLGAGCLVSGNPTTAGTANLTVTATDGGSPAKTASSAVTLTINPAALSVTVGPLPNGAVGAAYNQTIPVSGGTSPYSCTITSGTLPAGLSLGASCLISGTPTTAGTATLNVIASDSGNPVKTASGAVTLTINPAPLGITVGALPNGTAGVAYSQTVPVSGGTSPYSCTLLTGTLPAGLTLGAGCVVSGTPLLPGTSNLTVKATDSGNPVQTATGAISITIKPANLSITIGILPNGTVGNAYNQTIPVLGGTQPYTCAVTLGTLPAGLTMGSDCSVSGTPTAAGTSVFTVKATDSGNPAEIATAVISLTIDSAALTLTTGPLPNGTVGVAYSQTIPVNGGSSPYNCVITSGTLPAGLSLGAGCAVSGTPTTAGTASLTVTATDSSIPTKTASGAVTITISPAPLSITVGSLPNGVVGSLYNQTIPVTGGTAPFSCVIVAGTLPGGLALGSNCMVSGTPTAAGPANLVVRVTDSGNPAQSVKGAISITIDPAPLSVTIDPLPNGIVGTVYSQTIPVAGGTSPYSCTITSGTLPAGLSLGANCLVSGSPTTAGTSNLTVTATDSSNPVKTASGAISITIDPAALVVTVGPLPGGTVGVVYNQTIPVSGGTSPYSCTITSGTLPTGLSLGAGCVISGTPTTAGTANLTVAATDSSSPAKTASGAVTLTISPAALAVTVGPLPNGTVGTLYSQTIPVTGGTSPYSCTINSGTLPAGLSLGMGCVVSGTPTAAGTANLNVTATDTSNPVKSASGTVSITINPAALGVTVGALPNGTAGVAYSQIIPVTGGTSPYSCTIITGTLPAGLNLGAGCVVSGTPLLPGTSNLTVKATDSGNPVQSATSAISITIKPANLSISISILPTGTVGTVYNQTIPVVGGTPPYACSITLGALPTGLTMGSDCVVSGTPTVAGTAVFTVKATDSGSPAQIATAVISLTILPATLTLTTGPLPSGTVGTPYNQTIPVSGGTSPYSCTITGGTLPAGLALGAGCLISGTPTATGTANLSVLVTDSGLPPQTATGTVGITINPAALNLTTGALPNGTVGSAYSSTIPVTGGTSPYMCTIMSGTLPAGLMLGGNCQVTGTPTTAGTANLIIKVVDSGTPAESAKGPVSITISPAPLTVTTGALPSGTVGVVYSQTIPVTGGASPYSCTITSGTLQAGLTLGPNCLISGTPSASGTVSLGVSATDSSVPTGTASGTVTVLINPSASLVLTAPVTGTQGTPYSGTITVTGGTAPYTCSLSSGTLQTGLTLNSTCSVTGTPTTSGTSTIAVTATDSRTPTPTTTTANVGVVIVPGLTVGNPPPATAGQPYTGSIPVTGGTAPYSCSVAGGSSLPPGLSFSTGCTLTGTPTLPGAPTAQIVVTDSANPVDTKTATVTITVNPPITLTFTGTLPNAIVNQTYSQTLTATGGVGPYTYAVTSGTLPAGLSLSATTGIVSGTPTTVGASSFTITATDNEATPQTAALPLTLLVVYAPTPNDALLKGPYAFLFQGYDTVLAGTLAYQTATVGSFTADGSGVLTAGELDSNHQTSNPTGAKVSTNKLLGSYTIGSGNRGTMVISTFNADGTVAGNISYSIAVKAAVSPATTSASGTMNEADTGLLTGQRGGGTFLQQAATSFTNGLMGSYAFGMQGDIVCLPACSVNLQAGPVATVGQFAVTSGTLSGEADTNLASSNYPSATLSGTYGLADVNGRVQMSLTNPNIPNASYPVDFAVYMVNGNQAFVMSTDKHSAYMLLAGNLSSQTSTNYTNGSLSGQYVGYENAPTNPGLLGTTLQNVLNLSTATIFQGTASGAGSCTTNYVDQGGTTAVVNGLTGLGGNVQLLTDLLGTYASTGTSNCTVGMNGRAVINYPAPSNLLTGLLGLLGVTAQAPAPRVAYLTSTNNAYFLETGYAGLGNLERQTGQPFSLATLNGTYTYGTTPAATAVTLNASGTFTANGAGSENYVLDEDAAAGGLNVVTLGVSGSGTYVLYDAQNGRYTLGSDVLYAITPNRFVLVDKSAANPSPSVALIQ